MIKILTGHDLNEQMYNDFHDENDRVFREEPDNTISHFDYYDDSRYIDAAKKFFELPETTKVQYNLYLIQVAHLLYYSKYKNKKIFWWKPLSGVHPIFQAKFARIVCELHQRNQHDFTIVTNAMNFFTEIRRCIACGIVKVEDVKVIQYWKSCDLIPITEHGDIDYFKIPEDVSQKLFDGDLTCEQLTDIILTDEERKNILYIPC